MVYGLALLSESDLFIKSQDKTKGGRGSEARGTGLYGENAFLH